MPTPRRPHRLANPKLGPSPFPNHLRLIRSETSGRRSGKFFVSVKEFTGR